MLVSGGTLAPVAGAAIMGGAGLVVGGGTELANQVQSGEEINATAILNRAIGEGAKSTLFQIPGASLLGLGLGTAGIAAAENVGDNLAKGRMSADALLQAATDGAVEGGTVIAVGGITHAIGKATSSITNAAKRAVPKAGPVKPLPDEALEKIAGGAKDPEWRPGTNRFTSEKKDIVEKVIEESLSGKGNMTSNYTLVADQALELGNKLLGNGYSEVGKQGSGVFEKAVEKFTYRFRIDIGSISGDHMPNVPHVHVEILDENRRIIVNNHIPFID